MNMKVHQTLVWLNLLSFRTKDLAEPTIGIQSAAANQTHCSVILTLSHQRTDCTDCPAVTVPAVTVICRTGSCNCPSCNCDLPYWQWIDPQQCCQVAEIPAKKLKRGRGKKKFVAEFWLILPKTSRKGAAENFLKSSLFLAVITTCNVHQNKIKFDF